MTKEQENIAVKFMSTLKDNEGLMTAIEINDNPISKLFNFKSDLVVVHGLIDLGLLDIVEASVYRLTEKGWKFKSFRKLYFESRLQLINTKIVLSIAIITALINLYQTFFR